MTMQRTVVATVALAAAAISEVAAFSAAPHSLRLASANGAFTAKNSPPLSSMKRTQRKSAAVNLSMELLGKRYWMWNASEWMFDKFVALTQVCTFVARKNESLFRTVLPCQNSDYLRIAKVVSQQVAVALLRIW